MTIECIVLDFDGTFTLVDREAVPFVEGFVQDLRGIVGEAVISRWDATVERVKSEPDRYGWEYEERIVAPSHADPYILATTVGQILLAESGMEDRAERAKALEGLYQRNYPKSSNVFRPDAKRVVEAVVHSGIPVFVVTNSQTHHVEAKLDQLVVDLDVLGLGGGRGWRGLRRADPIGADDRFDQSLQLVQGGKGAQAEGLRSHHLQILASILRSGVRDDRAAGAREGEEGYHDHL